MLAEIVSSSGVLVVAVDYRRPPEHPYPASLIDALDVYMRLDERFGLAAEIFLGGDSAGANLAVSLAILLRDKQLRAPSGLVLLSPWIDLSDYQFALARFPPGLCAQ